MNYKNNPPILNSFPQKKGERGCRKSGFTLVELIVVITILAILGTIAFISLQGYSKSSRDSVRLSDMSNIKISLELFHLNAGKYASTTEGFSVTYSGSTVWTQGTFGEDTFKNVDRLDKIPGDPLIGTEYTYSLTNNKQEYQLAGIMEGDDLASNPLAPLSGGIATVIPQTNAGDLEMTALVTGNYNGKILKTSSGANCVILSVPSIISNQPETITDLVDILTATGLVYNGFNNLPSEYRNSKYNAEGGFDFVSNKLVAYSDSDSCKPLYGEDNSKRIELIENLKIAYADTVIKDKGGISGIVNVDTGDVNAVQFLGGNLVNNNLGGNVIVKKISINGDCGIDDGGSFTVFPTNLCNKGVVNISTNNFGSTYEWGCVGEYGGNNASCSAVNLKPKLLDNGVIMTYITSNLDELDVTNKASNGPFYSYNNGWEDKMTDWGDVNAQKQFWGATSLDDGYSNMQLIISLDPLYIFRIASYCKDLEILGFNDWYWPSVNELRDVQNILQFYGLHTTTDLTYYWSSTETGIGCISSTPDHACANTVWMNNGNISNTRKATNGGLRCIRKL